MLPPVSCSLRVAGYPLKGAHLVARQSRFHGCHGMGGHAALGMAQLHAARETHRAKEH